jgi:hypothetical protein
MDSSLSSPLLLLLLHPLCILKNEKNEKTETDATYSPFPIFLYSY